jgi:hypothetical protein
MSSTQEPNGQQGYEPPDAEDIEVVGGTMEAAPVYGISCQGRDV